MQPDSPVFSVIVPTYARPTQLAECLEALAKLDYPRERFEVLVVDDGSEAPPEAVTASFVDRLSVRLFTQPNAGPGPARNTGAGQARGRFLAFTDDDCTPGRGWLRSLEAAFADDSERLLGGRTINRLRHNPYAATSQVIVEAAYAFYNTDPAAARFFASNNMAVPAELFCKVGGFDRGFRVASEDRELCDRWLHAGHRMRYVPEAIVYHAHPLTFRSFCRQHFNYGRGALHYHETRARRRSGTFTQDIGFHARLPRLLRRPLAQLPRGQVATVGVLLGVWQVANALGFFYEKYFPRRLPSAVP
jgi:GT2 family glycosyltransferase